MNILADLTTFRAGSHNKSYIRTTLHKSSQPQRPDVLCKWVRTSPMKMVRGAGLCTAVSIIVIYTLCYVDIAKVVDPVW